MFYVDKDFSKGASIGGVLLMSKALGRKAASAKLRATQSEPRQLGSPALGPLADAELQDAAKFANGTATPA